MIFGTILLGLCPVPVAVFFCLFFTSQEINIKRSPNAAKLFMDFLWTRRPPMGQSSTWGCPEGAQPTWAHLGCGPLGGPPHPLFAYKFTNITKPFGVALDQKFRRRKASVSTETNLDPVPAPCRRGESSSVAIFIIPAVTMMRRE